MTTLDFKRFKLHFEPCTIEQSKHGYVGEVPGKIHIECEDPELAHMIVDCIYAVLLGMNVGHNQVYEIKLKPAAAPSPARSPAAPPCSPRPPDSDPR